MPRIPELLAALALALCLTTPALAQEPGWDAPLQGVSDALLGDRQGLGLLIVTPVDDEASRAVEGLLRQFLTDSGLTDVIMDDSPLGDVSGRSDDEIIEMARKYPVDIVIVLRAFPGANQPTAVMRVETIGGEPRSFRFQPGGAPPWAKKAPEPTTDPLAAAAQAAADDARAQGAMVRMAAVGSLETSRLVEAEQSRRVLEASGDPRSPVIRDPDAQVLRWPLPYEMMGRDDLAKRFRKRRTVKTATLASGAILATAGIGALFVGLANQANCSGGSNADCGRPELIGGGALSLSLGTIAVLTSVLLRKHPVPPDELQTLIERHNASLGR